VNSASSSGLRQPFPGPIIPVKSASNDHELAIIVAISNLVGAWSDKIWYHQATSDFDALIDCYFGGEGDSRCNDGRRRTRVEGGESLGLEVIPDFNGAARALARDSLGVYHRICVQWQLSVVMCSDTFQVVLTRVTLPWPSTVILFVPDLSNALDDS